MNDPEVSQEDFPIKPGSPYSTQKQILLWDEEDVFV